MDFVRGVKSEPNWLIKFLRQEKGVVIDVMRKQNFGRQTWKIQVL